MAAADQQSFIRQASRMECDFDRNQWGRELAIVKRLIDNIVGVIEPRTRQSWAIASRDRKRVRLAGANVGSYRNLTRVRANVDYCSVTLAVKMDFWCTVIFSTYG